MSWKFNPSWNVLEFYLFITVRNLMITSRAGANGIDIEVLGHHTISVSNFQSIEVSTGDRVVHF